MVKQIHNLVLSRKGTEPFGFRIIGGKDEGLSFKVGKVVTGSPASEAGLQVYDFLVSVQGQEVFDCDHATVVKLIRQAGNCLNLSVERGDHIVPNFEEIWPSGKGKSKVDGGLSEKGVNYVKDAMQSGIPGSRDGVFTTVGKPKVEVNQYDNPIQCYSDEVLQEMSEKGTWKLESHGVAGQGPPAPPAAGGALAGAGGGPDKFQPQKSAVLAVLNDQDKGNSYQR